MTFLDLAQFKSSGTFPANYPANQGNWYAPEDNVHGLLKAILGTCQSSLVLNMYGFADDELSALIVAHAQNPKIYVQMSLDKSQAGGVHERKLLESVKGQPACNLAIGTSSKHAISHLKVCIIDGLWLITGSTNWSLSGESAQDNQVTVTCDAALAAEARAILDRNHAFMLTQGNE